MLKILNPISKKAKKVKKVKLDRQANACGCSKHGKCPSGSGLNGWIANIEAIPK